MKETLELKTQTSTSCCWSREVVYFVREGRVDSMTSRWRQMKSKNMGAGLESYATTVYAIHGLGREQIIITLFYKSFYITQMTRFFLVAFLYFSHENILNAGPIQSTYWAIKLNKISCSIQFNTSNDNATLDELLHGSETCELLVASISKRVVTKEKTPNNDIFSQKKHTLLFHLPMVLQAEVSNSSNSENYNSKDDTNNSSSRWTTWS